MGFGIDKIAKRKFSIEKLGIGKNVWNFMLQNFGLIKLRKETNDVKSGIGKNT
jgi:hypothetical protein